MNFMSVTQIYDALLESAVKDSEKQNVVTMVTVGNWMTLQTLR